MVRSIISLGITTALAALLSADATTVSVLELGKGGVVHKTDASSPTSTTAGVISFLKLTHDADNNGNRRLNVSTQNPGMSVVPDIFSRATGGIMIGITGEASSDLESMPNVASIIESGDNAAGQFSIPGDNGRKLMTHVGASNVEASNFASTLDAKANDALADNGNKLESVHFAVDNKEDAVAADNAVARMLKSLAKDAEKAGSTVVVHLVVDAGDEAARRRLDEDGDAAKTQIPGYMTEDGQFVTRYKTIHQIQYYNVVLWTGVGLTLLIVVANLMTMNMPLMPDTLLFGESAKMVAE